MPTRATFIVADPFFSPHWSSCPFEGRGYVHKDKGSVKESSESCITATTPMDVKEDKDSFVFIADVPGLQKDEVKVQLEDSEAGRTVLTISGERKREKNENDAYHRAERTFGKFVRKFGLPDAIDADKISASCDHGVLTVRVPKLPKVEKKVEPTIIPVE